MGRTKTAAWDVELGKLPKSEARQGVSKNVYREIWDAKVWRIWVVLALIFTCFALQLPIRPEMMRDFFAGRRAGHPVSCQQYTGPEPAYCAAAHSDAVWAQAISEAVSMSGFNFLLAPAFGRLSDRFGRRFFLALVVSLTGIAPVMLACHETFKLSLFVYFPALAFQGEGLLLTLSASYVSDLISPSNRATALSLNLAGIAFAYTVGPVVSGRLPTRLTVWLSAGGSVVAILLMLFAVPESVSESAKQQASERQRADSWVVNVPWNCLKVMGKNKTFTLLGVIAAMSGFCQMGIVAVLPQYLELKLDFTKEDLGSLFTIAGACGMFTQIIVIRLLQRFLGEKRILMFSTFARLLEVALFSFGINQGLVYAGIVFGGLAYLVNVSTSSILSKNTAYHEQGNVQGALYGIVCFMQGVGSPGFALVFSLFSKHDSSIPYFPGAPYVFGAGIMVVAFLLTFFINREAAEGRMEDDRSTASDLSFVRTLSGMHDGRRAESLLSPRSIWVEDYFGQIGSAPGTQIWKPDVPESAFVAAQQSPHHAIQDSGFSVGPSYVVQEEDEASSYYTADNARGRYLSDSSDASSYYDPCSSGEDLPGGGSPRWPSHYPHIPKLDFSFLHTARSAYSTTFRSALTSLGSPLSLVQSTQYATCRSDPDFVDIEANILAP